jgi:hypothetical protein|tara:strand:- start:16 stop:498 length:483 start_codon:yes stop_codon:yes gene_type:complete
MKKIIVKESQLINITEKVIKEQISDDPNSFSTEIQDVDFYGLENHFPEYKGRDMDVVYTNCSVNWRYDMDIRSWGIKDISIYTTSVVINATIEVYDEEYTKVEVEKEIELMVDDMGGFSSDEEGKWHYEDEKEDEMRYHTILPTALQIDLNDKHISIMWN